MTAIIFFDSNYFIDQQLESKLDMLIVHTGTNNLFSKLSKIDRKCLELSPETKFVFSNIIIRKEKTNLDKHRKDVNEQMKKFYKRKDIGLIDNCNLEEHDLGSKKLRLNNEGDSAFAKNILHSLDS